MTGDKPVYYESADIEAMVAEQRQVNEDEDRHQHTERARFNETR